MKAKGFFQFLVTVILVLMTLSPAPVKAESPQVLFVVQGGSTGGSCGSWTNACELQYALGSAVPGQELWVSAGVYKPGTTRTDAFQLKSGVGLYGGFKGMETARDERDWQANKTVLSGDIDNNDTNADGNFIAETTADIQGENAYHVLIGSGTDLTAVLDGFVITAGQADGSASSSRKGGSYNPVRYPAPAHNKTISSPAQNEGGGMYIYEGSPTFIHLYFIGNSARYGGGMINRGSSPTLKNVTFSANSAMMGGGMLNQASKPSLTNVVFFNNSAMDFSGGGMDNSYSDPILTNVIFSANTAMDGGGMSNASSNPELLNVTFSANAAIDTGGGMANFVSSPTLTRVSFLANTAGTGGAMYLNNGSTPALLNVIFSNNSSYLGGGIYNDSGNPTLTNVIFFANSATQGGGMYNAYSNPTLTNNTFSANTADTGGAINNASSNPILLNSILWGDSALNGPEIYNYQSVPAVAYSDIQGGYAGTGNINADPLFLDTANGNLRLQAGSPAIDSGINTDCPATDFDSVTRPQDGNNDGTATCDMGAFEYSSSGHPNEPPIADAGGPYQVNEGAMITLDASTSSDPDGDQLTYEWDLDSDGVYDDSVGVTAQVSFPDNGQYTVSVRVTDPFGAWDTAAAQVTVLNVAPLIREPLDLPNLPVLVGSTVNAGAVFTDPGVLDTHTANWNWGDGTNSSGSINGYSVTGSHGYTQPGLYTVTLTVSDDDGGIDTVLYQYVVAYSPEAGFITGGGWIKPAVNKAYFEFNVKYLKDTQTPDGNVKFRHSAAALHFTSSHLEWLVIHGEGAQIKGSGTINGKGDYLFILSVMDGGKEDRFRIKIWDKTSGNVIYDDQPGAEDAAGPTTPVKGGSIVIHKAK